MFSTKQNGNTSIIVRGIKFEDAVGHEVFRGRFLRRAKGDPVPSKRKPSTPLSTTRATVKSRFVEMFEGTVFSKAKLPDMVWFQEGPGVRNYQYTSSGVKLLNVANLHDGKLDLSNTNRFISKEEAYGRYKHFLVDSGDLIIASSGIKVEYFDKKIGFASKEHLPLCMNTSTIRFKVLDESALDIIYFEHFLKSTSFKRQLERQITGSAQLNFGPSHLKKMWVDVPPLALQQEFAAFVSQVDKLRFEACYAMYLLCAAFTLL